MHDTTLVKVHARTLRVYLVNARRPEGDFEEDVSVGACSARDAVRLGARELGLPESDCFAVPA